MVDLAESHEVKSVAINQDAGTTDIVAAVTGKAIVVIDYVLCLPKSNTAYFQTKTTGTALTGVLSADDGSGFDVITAGPSPYGLFRTVVGEALQLVSSGAADGHLNYIEV